MPTTITFASLLDPAGVVIAAGLVTGLVELLKTTFPPLDARVSGALMAFVLSAVLYVLAAASVGTATLDDGLVVFFAWLSCAMAAVGIKATSAHVGDVRGNG